MFSSTGSRDALAVFLGLSLVVGIGAWSVFRLTHTSKTELSDTEKTAPDVARDFRTFSRDDLRDIVLRKKADSQRVIIADTRPASLWSEEHIIGSQNFPIEEAEQFLQSSLRDQEISWIIVAPDTHSAGRFVTLLRSRGITNERIAVLEGTYEKWKEDTGLIVKKADPSSPVDITKVRFASPEEAKEQIGRGGQWFILDTRSPDQFSESHIAGATNIPFAKIEEKRRTIPPSVSILVYGADDRESFSAGVLLFDLGFFNTTTLSTGFTEWKTKGLPISER